MIKLYCCHVFRKVLIAGGGIGDSTLFLAEQLNHTEAEVNGLITNLITAHISYRVFSKCTPFSSISVPKRKPPITTAVPVNPVVKKGHDWLLGGFLVGTEIGGYQ